MRKLVFEKERQVHTDLQTLDFAKKISAHSFLVLNLLKEKGEKSGEEIHGLTGIEKHTAGQILTHLMQNDLAILRYDSNNVKRYSFETENGGKLLGAIESNQQIAARLMSNTIAAFAVGIDYQKLVGSTKEVYRNILKERGLLRE